MAKSATFEGKEYFAAVFTLYLALQANRGVLPHHRSVERRPEPFSLRSEQTGGRRKAPRLRQAGPAPRPQLRVLHLTSVHGQRGQVQPGQIT